jgi:ring-1,2-phenylacetyl-CoA epoxidase subunit PaaD
MVTAAELVAAVPDPELPMLTIADLGILRDVTVTGDGVEVTITPTYSGCPAMDAIRADIRAALPGHRVTVHTVLSPPWTTDWITPAGRAALAASGIAPPDPAGRGAGPVLVQLSRRAPEVRCPQCGAGETREVSRFSSTACMALHACRACGEPFSRMKAL